ncbi:unnamed protein product [Nezara viridula]|uniref:Uncharacterized protein n=1 Tax=Nezara viridula TaxID=85310 RepID=A0A9P0HRX7_NEZVI|nr:unnamed protein product [Nezara viridula]
MLFISMSLKINCIGLFLNRLIKA